MLTCILLQIFTRTFLRLPFPWTDEMARFTFLWFCLVGSSLTLRHHLHLGIDYFMGKMKPKAQFVNRIFVYALIILFGVCMVIFGIQLLFIVGRQRSPTIRLPMWWIYLCLPLTGSLYAVLGSWQLACHVTGMKDDRHLGEADTSVEDVKKGAAAALSGGGGK
jgi:TRAP-type C4-dicarboxylate transport system permease small subunit